MEQASLENSLELGNGIYTIPEIAKILRLPYYKVNTWVNKYWDGRLGQEFKKKYSWTINDTKAVGFHTLVEFYILYLLAESGVKTKEVLEAHKELTRLYKTFFPFAQKNILENINTDGYKVYISIEGDILSLDGTKQFNLNFIKLFFKNLDFDRELLASRFYPLGRDKKIIIDPKRKFGHPIIGNTNIYPETLYNMYKAGEPVDFIAYLYEIDNNEVLDAIEFCKVA
ncbi:MAG: DUF433 domain-containing protein [Candidatus Woesearchaeota archaeon]